MILQYRFEVENDANEILLAHWAYRMYSWLLQQTGREMGNSLHEQGETPVSQALCYDKAGGKNIWTVNLLSNETVEAFSPTLERLEKIELYDRILKVKRIGCERIESAMQMIARARHCAQDVRRTRLAFLTPTSFKHAGRYEIYPQMRLILQSTIHKWNAVFPEFQLSDEDCFNALEQGLQITDYVLRTTRFPLKNAQIPGFFGNISIQSRLAVPIEEIWQLLLAFIPYCGIGIKTALGMGCAAQSME